MNDLVSNDHLALVGEVILLASMQFSIGSVEMSSKFSVKNFSKDQETLQNGADALMDYVRIGLIWTFALSLLFFSRHGIVGFILCCLANVSIMLWIYCSYIHAFKMAMKKYNLKYPSIVLW